MSSKRPVDVTVLSARNLRKLRLVTAPPVAVVIVERHNDRFVTNPGTTNSSTGDDAVWKARHVFYVDEELVSGDEPANIRVDVFDSSVLDCLLGTASISLETAMDHYNKAHTYALMAEGRSCGSVTLAVSVAPKSRAPLSFPPPSSSLPGPLYGPPLPGDPPPLQKQTSGQMPTPVRGGSLGRESRSPASSSSPAFFRSQSHPSGPPPTGPSSSVYMNNSSPVPNYNQGYSNGSSQPSSSQPHPRQSYNQGPPMGYSSQPGPMNGPDHRVRAPPPPPPGQYMHPSHSGQSGPYQPPGPSAPYLSPPPPSGYGPPRGYPSQTPYPPPYNHQHFSPPPPPPPGYTVPQRGHSSHPPGAQYPPQRSMDRNRGEGYGGVGDMGTAVVEGLVIGAAAGFVVGEILDDDDDDIF